MGDVLRNLIVNYIPVQVDQSYLQQLFEMYGPTESVKIIVDKESNTSRGFGFVKYVAPQSATLAIQNLNGYPLLNKRLKVAYAKQDEAQRMLMAINQNPYDQFMQYYMMGGQHQGSMMPTAPHTSMSNRGAPPSMAGGAPTFALAPEMGGAASPSALVTQTPTAAPQTVPMN